MSSKNRSAGRERARAAIAARNAARVDTEKQIKSKTEDYYCALDALETARAVIAKLETDVNTAIVGLADLGLNNAELCTLTGLTNREVTRMLKEAKEHTAPAAESTPEKAATPPASEHTHSPDTHEHQTPAPEHAA